MNRFLIGTLFLAAGCKTPLGSSVKEIYTADEKGNVYFYRGGAKTVNVRKCPAWAPIEPANNQEDIAAMVEKYCPATDENEKSFDAEVVKRKLKILYTRSYVLAEKLVDPELDAKMRALESAKLETLQDAEERKKSVLATLTTITKELEQLETYFALNPDLLGEESQRKIAGLKAKVAENTQVLTGLDPKLVATEAEKKMVEQFSQEFSDFMKKNLFADLFNSSKLVRLGGTDPLSQRLHTVLDSLWIEGAKVELYEANMGANVYTYASKFRRPRVFPDGDTVGLISWSGDLVRISLKNPKAKLDHRDLNSGFWGYNMTSYGRRLETIEKFVGFDVSQDGEWAVVRVAHNSGERPELWMANLKDGKKNYLISRPSYEVVNRGVPRFSPDGESVTTTELLTKGSREPMMWKDWRKDVIVRSLGQNKKVVKVEILTDSVDCTEIGCNDPIFLPDGKRILYSHQGTEFRIISASNGEILSQLKLSFDDLPKIAGTTVQYVKMPELLSDGKTLIFTAEAKHGSEIWKMNLDGSGNIIRLTNADFDGSCTSGSAVPSTSMIIFECSTGNRKSSVWTLDGVLSF